MGRRTVMGLKPVLAMSGISIYAYSTSWPLPQEMNLTGKEMPLRSSPKRRRLSASTPVDASSGFRLGGSRPYSQVRANRPRPRTRASKTRWPAPERIEILSAPSVASVVVFCAEVLAMVCRTLPCRTRLFDPCSDVAAESYGRLCMWIDMELYRADSGPPLR